MIFDDDNDIDIWWKVVFICKWSIDEESIDFDIWWWRLLIFDENACLCVNEGIDEENVILIFGDDDDYWYLMKMRVICKWGIDEKNVCLIFDDDFIDIW